MAWKILLADDSVTAQNMGRKILTDAGYDVVTVNNGSAALKRVSEIHPDLIILDVYMPGYSGLEVCQRLKDAAETAHIPILLTVGKLEPFKADEGRRARADNHIVKPFEASELLTAITRLEDRIVSQHNVNAERSRGKNKTVEDTPETESGWKSRLSFSSKSSSKAETEEKERLNENAAVAATFRDFRTPKAKTAVSGSVSTKPAPPPGQEPGLVPDVPRDLPRAFASDPLSPVASESAKITSKDAPCEASIDVRKDISNVAPGDITPDEMDALGALASKLNPQVPSAYQSAIIAAAEEDASKAASAAVEANEIQPPALTSPVVPPAIEAPAFAVEGPAFVVEGTTETKSEVEIPVQQVEPELGAAKTPELGTEASQHSALRSEIEQPNAQVSESPETAAAVAAVSAALPAEESAPVDSHDEPMFASFANAGQAIEALALPENEQIVEASTSSEAVTAEPEAKEVEPPAADSVHSREPEGAAPSDAELVEALRLLTPATAEGWTIPSSDKLVAAGQLLAEEAMRSAAAAPRWVAEPMTLSPEEAATSLEAEMNGSLAPRPADSVVSDGESRGITGVSAIAAAVENRLAESELAASAVASPEPAAGTDAASTPEAVSPHLTGNEGNGNGAAEAAPKALAAAAAESSAPGAADASTIASIVDSVMADLRPRIVEEIARKLAKRD